MPVGGFTPVGGFSRDDYIQAINQIQDLVEDCIRRYMRKSECVQYLQLHHSIDPVLTETIWNKLEELNKEFFEQYYLRLVLIEQINTFNTLLEEQARQMGIPVNTNGQSPAAGLNGHQASSSTHMNTNGLSPAAGLNGHEAPPSAPVNTSDQSPAALNSETGSGSGSGSGSVDDDKTLPNSK